MMIYNKMSDDFPSDFLLYINKWIWCDLYGIVYYNSCDGSYLW